LLRPAGIGTRNDEPQFELFGVDSKFENLKTCPTTGGFENMLMRKLNFRKNISLQI
jgi:hypothetical protein